MPPDAPAAEPPAVPPAAPVAPQPAAEFGEAFAAIDALGREDGTPAPPERPTPGDGRKHGPDGKFLPKGDKPPEKPAAAVKPEPKLDDDIDPTKLKTSELAKHYHKLKAEQKEWVKKREELEAKLKAPTEWPEKKTYEEKLAEREKALEDHKKRVEQYERELQFTNFTKSQAYKDQYQKPLEQAYKMGQSKTAMLQIVERKDAEENVIQTARDATEKDFDAIMRITDERTAIKKAHEMFGEAAAVVLAYRERVYEKNAVLEEAVREYETKGAEREKVMREQSEKEMKHLTGMIDKFQQAAVDKYPQLFKPDDSDPKGNELLEKGSHLLQRVLNGGAPVKEGDKQMTAEEMAIATAAVRNKAAAFDRVNHRRHVAEKRVKELEKELEQFKASRPGNGDAKGRAPTQEEDDPKKKIWALGREI